MCKPNHLSVNMELNATPSTQENSKFCITFPYEHIECVLGFNTLLRGTAYQLRYTHVSHSKVQHCGRGVAGYRLHHPLQSCRQEQGQFRTKCDDDWSLQLSGDLHKGTREAWVNQDTWSGRETCLRKIHHLVIRRLHLVRPEVQIFFL